jgi:hypothetical protein
MATEGLDPKQSLAGKVEERGNLLLIRFKSPEARLAGAQVFVLERRSRTCEFEWKNFWLTRLAFSCELIKSCIASECWELIWRLDYFLNDWLGQVVIRERNEVQSAGFVSN